jgi:hypothetical protein
LFAIVAAAVGWSWWMNRPLAQISLPDGSKLILYRTTPGGPYRSSVPAPPNANVLQKLWHAFDMVSETLPASSEVGFYFRWIGPDGKWISGHPPITTVDGWAVHSTSSEQVIPWQPAAFPKRGKSFQVRVYSEGQGSNAGAYTIWEIPNPLAGTNFPVWTADPFPSQARVAELPVTLEGWTYLPERDLLKSHNKDARRRILSDGGALGLPALMMKSPVRPDLDFICIERHLSDATGNAAFSGLPYSESAWQVDAMVEYGRIAPISPEHWISVGRLTVPESTSETKVTVPYALTKHRIVSARLTGSKSFSIAARDRKGAALILNLSRPEGEPSETLRQKRPYSRILEGRCRKLGEIEWTLVGVDSPFRSLVPMGPVVMRLPDQFAPGTEFELELLRSEIAFMTFVVPPPPAPNTAQKQSP